MDSCKQYTRDELIARSGCGSVAIDLGCGSRKKPCTIGIDKYDCGSRDNIVCDIEKGIPIKDNSVDRIYATYFLEHVGNLIFVFEEIYRVLVPGGTVELLVPYYASINAFKDPTHKQFFTEDTFRYFSKDRWYGSDYNIRTNFDVIYIRYFYSNLVKWLPFKKYLRRHLFNTVGAMEVKLKAVKNER